jgi:DNA-binding CsgD family transcriptional regulator
VTDGKLSAVAPAHASCLRGLIDAAATRDGAGRVGGSMSIGSASRRRPLHVSVAPNRAEALSMFGADPGVIVHITDLEAPLTVPLERLSVLFGLTRAEARLVRTLYEGATLREAAEQFGVSAHTVHAQLSRIFEKTGVRRQSELAKLMARVAVVDPD